MSEQVLVVARTHMRSGVCLGGLVMRNGQAVRLLDAEGAHFDDETDLDVGHLHNMSFSKVKPVQLPHTEDVRVMSYGQGQPVDDLVREILARANPVEGGPKQLFDGHLLARETGKHYLDPARLASHSTEFWRPNEDLELDVHDWNGKVSYEYYGDEFRVRYVGCAEPPEVIEAGKLARASLSRPFAVQGLQPVCWLQLSHAY